MHYGYYASDQLYCKTVIRYSIPKLQLRFYLQRHHCVKSIRIWSYSGLFFSAFRLNSERYRVTPYSVRMREITDQNQYGHFLRSAYLRAYQTSMMVLFAKIQNQPLEVFEKKVFLKNFTKFTGKHLCRNSFLIKLQTWGKWVTIQSSERKLRWNLHNWLWRNSKLIGVQCFTKENTRKIYLNNFYNYGNSIMLLPCLRTI